MRLLTQDRLPFLSDPRLGEPVEHECQNALFLASYCSGPFNETPFFPPEGFTRWSFLHCSLICHSCNINYLKGPAFFPQKPLSSGSVFNSAPKWSEERSYRNSVNKNESRRMGSVFTPKPKRLILEICILGCFSKDSVIRLVLRWFFLFILR